MRLASRPGCGSPWVIGLVWMLAGASVTLASERPAPDFRRVEGGGATGFEASASAPVLGFQPAGAPRARVSPPVLRVERFGYTGGADQLGLGVAVLGLPSLLSFVPKHPEAWVGGGDLLFAAVFGLMPYEQSEYGPWPLASRVALVLGLSGLGAYQLAQGDEFSDWERLGINYAGVFATVLATDLLFVKR